MRYEIDSKILHNKIRSNHYYCCCAHNLITLFGHTEKSFYDKAYENSS